MCRKGWGGAAWTHLKCRRRLCKLLGVEQPEAASCTGCHHMSNGASPQSAGRQHAPREGFVDVALERNDVVRQRAQEADMSVRQVKERVVADHRNTAPRNRIHHSAKAHQVADVVLMQVRTSTDSGPATDQGAGQGS